MRYGGGGTAGWASLCGALNGSAALIGLFTKKDDDLKILVDEMFLWYEQTELPVYIPKKPTYNIEITKSISVSVLCHVSVTKWCKVSGHKAFSKAQKERCKRLAADTARKTVEVLNAHFVGQTSVARQFNKKTKECRSCHTKGSELQNTRGKMSCTSCHSFNLNKHPQGLKK
jgi:NADH pyrophosphatase NudC (nudix superfamily)